MRAEDVTLLDDLATCLEYPGSGYEQKKTLAGRHRALAETPALRRMGRALSGLALYLGERGKDACEEAYTRLFDLSPVCTLHLGYQLFGDSYERGELLARLVPEIRDADIPLDGELPDFLPVLLRLFARLADVDDRKLLAELLLLPALEKMGGALESSSDPWSAIVRALPDLLRESIPAESKEALAHA